MDDECVDDEYVNKGKVIAMSAWLAVIAFMVLGWTIMIAQPDHWRVAGMFAATACGTSAMAATLHVHCYMVSLARLLRVSAGLADPEFERPRPVPDR